MEMEQKRKKRTDTLWILCSKCIRAKGYCEICGRSGLQLHAHHGVVHRRYVNTRYEEDNLICVCVSCHNELHDFTDLNVEVFRKRIGRDRMEQLSILARSGKKVDKEAIKQSLKEKIKLLGE